MITAVFGADEPSGASARSFRRPGQLRPANPVSPRRMNPRRLNGPGQGAGGSGLDVVSG